MLLLTYMRLEMANASYGIFKLKGFHFRSFCVALIIWSIQVYRNAPLKPGTLYRLGVTAVNEAGRSHLYYSAPIMTTSLTSGAKVAAIVVPLLVVTALAIALAIYFYRKRDEYMSKSKNTQIAGDNFTPIQADGLENAAFSMDKVRFQVLNQLFSQIASVLSHFKFGSSGSKIMFFLLSFLKWVGSSGTTIGAINFNSLILNCSIFKLRIWSAHL